jgi:hypothetical protein
MKIKDFLLEKLESDPAFFAAYWHEQDLLDSQEPVLPTWQPPIPQEQSYETYVHV